MQPMRGRYENGHFIYISRAIPCLLYFDVKNMLRSSGINYSKNFNFVEFDYWLMINSNKTFSFQH